MAPSRAADLRIKWKLRTHPPLCGHLHLERETSEDGYVTGDHYCLVCGALVVKVSEEPSNA